MKRKRYTWVGILLVALLAIILLIIFLTVQSGGNVVSLSRRDTPPSGAPSPSDVGAPSPSDEDGDDVFVPGVPNRPILPSPPPVTEPTPEEITEDFVEAVTERASIAFDSPEAMEQGDITVPELRLSLEFSLEDLVSEIDTKNVLTEAEILVTREVVARLTNPSRGFTVEEITPRKQVVRRQGQNIWKWSVTADKPGEHPLFLTINSLIRTPIGVNNVEIQSFQRQISVSVKPISWSERVATFIREHWQWLATAILLPLIAFFYQKLFGRKKEE